MGLLGIDIQSIVHPGYNLRPVGTTDRPLAEARQLVLDLNDDEGEEISGMAHIETRLKEMERRCARMEDDLRQAKTELEETHDKLLATEAELADKIGQLKATEAEWEEFRKAAEWDEPTTRNRDMELRELFTTHYEQLIAGRQRFGNTFRPADWKKAKESFPEATYLWRKKAEEDEEKELKARKESEKLEREAKHKSSSFW